jgi:hypothetical protein
MRIVRITVHTIEDLSDSVDRGINVDRCGTLDCIPQSDTLGDWDASSCVRPPFATRSRNGERFF